MSDPAQPVEIVEVSIAEIARPSHSLILADGAFLATLRTVEATVASLKITDAQSSQQAADLLGRLTKAGTALEKQRQELKRPYLDLMSKIDAAAKAPAERIAQAKRTLSSLQTTFAQEQARIAREAEEKRQKEIKELEEKVAREKKEAEEKAAKIAADLKAQQEAADKVRAEAEKAGLPVVVVEDWDEAPAPEPFTIVKTEAEVALERVRFAPAPVATKAPVGVRTVVTLFPHVEDVNLLPDYFIEKTAKIAAIRSTFCNGWKEGDKIPECAGVRFEVQRSTQSTGRSTF